MAIFGFLLTISILVVIHELGHYLFARLFNIKVISFSVGFGPCLIKWQGRHNEWCIRLLPLGGYVRILDEREGPIDHKLKPFAYNNKPPYQKLLVAFAGPLFNIIFAFLIYYSLGLYGVDTLKPNIQSVNPSNLVSGLDKLPVKSTILEINDHKVNSWSEAEDIFEHEVAISSKVNIKFSNDNKTQTLDLDLKKFIENTDNQTLTALGLYPINYLPIISYIEPQSPAAKAGLKENDIIAKIDNQALNSWFKISDTIRSSPGKNIQIEITRDGKQQQITVIPDSAIDDDGQIIGKVGIMPTLDSTNLLANSYIKRYGAFSSINYAYTSCYNLTLNNFTILYSMLQGKVSWHNLGGPVTIAKASQNALAHGVKTFVDLLALISISLAIMNLLPIPILDGGHILLYSIEWIRGKPITNAAEQLLLKLGLAIVLTITGLALYNDVLKLFNL